MPTWLISSSFLASLPSGGEGLLIPFRNAPGHDAANHLRIASLRAGDLVLEWDLEEDRLTRSLVVIRDFLPEDGFAHRGARVFRKLVRHDAFLAPGLGRDWLRGFDERHMRHERGYILFKSKGGGLQFNRRSFCQKVSEAALEELGIRQTRHGEVEERDGQIEIDVPSCGPPPSGGEWNVARSAEGPGYRYLLRFQGSDTWKVGYAGNVEQRLQEINLHMPRGPGQRPLGWVLVMSELYSSLHDAYAAEQVTLARLSHLSLGGEQFHGPETEILRGWGMAHPEGHLAA